MGYTHVQGDLLPVIVNINPINPVGQLADGRPIFGSTTNADTRLDPRFNQINVVQSVGDSTYNALALQFGKRLSGGMQFDFNYTIGKGTDNAPMTSALSVQGDDGVRDPTNLERDRGPNVLDTRHSFTGASCAAEVRRRRRAGAIAEQQPARSDAAVQLGPAAQRAQRTDLNGDGMLADRPLVVARNSIYLPARYNIDLRFSRFVPLGGPLRLEVVAEFKNVINTVQTSAVNRMMPTNAMASPRPRCRASSDQLQPTAGYEQRQFQLGFKLYF